MRKSLLALFVATLLFGVATPSHAELTTFLVVTGNVGYSADGFGSTTQSGTISASIPAGATILAAYLYTSTYDFSAAAGLPAGGTLNGVAVTYTALGVNTDACCELEAGRADVTAIVAAEYDGVGGIYDFTVTETFDAQDGEALIVIYELASLPVSTVAILDGFSLSGGDTATLNFADPLDPTAPGFFAEMAIGDGFSFNPDGDSFGQASTIEVNSTLITAVAGNYDDGLAANGALFTMGGFDDPFTPFQPANSEDDHERYNLTPYIDLGDTSITVRTANVSFDDNIFLEVFHVTGEATVTTDPEPVPEPTSLLLLGAGLFGLAALRRRNS